MWKHKHIGKLKEEKGYFGKVGLYRLTLVSTIRLLHGHKPSPRDGIHNSSNFSEISAFKQIRKEVLKRFLSASVCSQLTSAQNNTKWPILR